MKLMRAIETKVGPIAVSGTYGGCGEKYQLATCPIYLQLAQKLMHTMVHRLLVPNRYSGQLARLSRDNRRIV